MIRTKNLWIQDRERLEIEEEESDKWKLPTVNPENNGEQQPPPSEPDDPPF